MFPCSRNPSQLVKLLLRKGTNIDVRYKGALISAADRVNEAVVKLLLEAGADTEIETTPFRDT